MSADVADAVAKKLQGASFLLQPWTVHLHAQPQRLLFGAVSEFYEEVRTYEESDLLILLVLHFSH